MMVSIYRPCELSLLISTSPTFESRVRFALSDERTFKAGNLLPRARGGVTAAAFPYMKFYQNIIKVIEDQMPDDERLKLLGWYTSCVLYRHRSLSVATLIS